MTHDYKGTLEGIEWKMNDGSFTNAEKLAIISALQLAQEAEQVRKENGRLWRENEVYAERHKAWESCVYMVGLPMMKAVRDTEYGDAVPPIPVVNKITDLLDECFKLRKERDELAVALENILHSAFEHGSQNLSGKTLDPDGEMLWKAKQLIKKIRGAKDEIR